MSYKVASLSVACVAWRFWLGALNNKGGWGQRNCKEIGAGTAWTTASPLVRARFARVFPSPLSRAPSLTRVSPSRAVLSCAHYFQVPAMQAIPTWKSYLRRDNVHLHSPSPVFTIWEPGGYSTKGRSRRKFLIKPETNLGVAQPFLTPNHFKTQRVLIIHGKDIIMEYFNLYPYIVLILKETFTAKYNGVLPRTPWVRSKSEIHTPKLDDEHPRPFHMGNPPLPPPPPRRKSKRNEHVGMQKDAYFTIVLGSITSRCSWKWALTRGGSKTGPGRRRKSSLLLSLLHFWLV